VCKLTLLVDEFSISYSRSDDDDYSSNNDANSDWECADKGRGVFEFLREFVDQEEDKCLLIVKKKVTIFCLFFVPSRNFIPAKLNILIKMRKLFRETFSKSPYAKISSRENM
jgi:hypothetical protein